MKTIVQLFREAWKAKYSDLGFYRHNNSYYRVVNNIVQSFVLERIMSGREARILFSIYPLCAGIRSPYYQRYDLKRFVAPYNVSEFDFDLHDEIMIKKCLQKLFDKIDDIMIPAFRRAIDDEAAFMVNHSLLNPDWNSRYLAQKGIGNKASFYEVKDIWSEEELMSVEQRALALNLQRYDFAIASFQEEIKFERQAIAEEQTIMKEYPFDYVIKTSQNRIEIANSLIPLYENWIEHIEANDSEWIFERLHENEEQTIVMLKSIAPLSKLEHSEIYHSGYLRVVAKDGVVIDPKTVERIIDDDL